MPEGYTHIRTAQAAARLAELNIPHEAAFGCGANGPDILFCYRVWRKGAKRGENLPRMGDQLHNENTGLFLRTLLQNADTPAERSYALGFLAHYATDCTIHPYVVHLCKPGQLYGHKGGHGYFEIGLDSWLHKQDTGRGAVRVNDNTPKLFGTELAEVGALLQKGIRAALGLTVSREALADTFWHTRAMRSLFVSHTKIKYILFWLLEPLFGGRGFITGHVTPARLKGTRPRDKHKLPKRWVHPFTGEQMQQDINALLEAATRRSAAYMLAAEGYWSGRFQLDRVMGLVGSANYVSGIADEQSAPSLPPQEVTV